MRPPLSTAGDPPRHRACDTPVIKKRRDKPFRSPTKPPSATTASAIQRGDSPARRPGVRHRRCQTLLWRLGRRFVRLLELEQVEARYGPIKAPTGSRSRSTKDRPSRSSARTGRRDDNPARDLRHGAKDGEIAAGKKIGGRRRSPSRGRDRTRPEGRGIYSERRSGNVLLGGVMRRGSRDRATPRPRSSTSHGSRTAVASRPGRSPAASSRCSRSPARSSPGRAC